jgi:hypothetical protein
MSYDGNDRFPLLLYQSIMGRYRRPSLLLTVFLAGLWLPASNGVFEWPSAEASGWLLSGAAVSAIFYLFAILGPRLAYVQPRNDHLRLRTPIYRLNISYQRIQTTRPVNLKKTYPPESLGRASRRALAPHYGRTALGIDLRSLPLSPFLLRWFFHPLFLAPDRPGFILIVEDWMRLSEQLSDRMERGRSHGSPDSPRHFSDAARILSEKSKDD